MLMKRWESPRREGRNDKGKKNSARQRQIKKATKALRLKLKGMEGKEQCSFPFLRLWVKVRLQNLHKKGGSMPPIVL
jgi:hypothetical protein